MRLLFEIGMEELPARFLVQTLNDIKEKLNLKLKENRIKFDDITTFGTPRRLVFLVEGISETQEDLDILNIGPKKEVAYTESGEISGAGLGFLKSQDVSIEKLEIVSTPKGEYVGVRKFLKGEDVKGLLPDILKNIVLEINFVKSMRWGEKKLKFARPIQWLLALLDNDVVEFEIEGIKSGKISNGHRFFGKQFEVKNIDEYFSKIKENNVIIDIEERKNLIRTQIKEKCEKNDEKVSIDENLLDEVSNLIEHPYVIVGTFNSDFLEVPQEVLIITMQVHQRYFPILDSNGKLLPKFVVVRNGIDESDLVRVGNEKVLSARLADARFFYNEDLKKPLIENVEKLKNVVFQKDLGTIYDKIKRSEQIADYLIQTLSLEANEKDIKRTILLSKADLVSNMIGEKEFTKLQGFMGAEYALKSGETEFVSKGIEEHYYPRFQGDILPQGIEGIITGLSDRMDTLCGCFGVGIIPSGSKDPFALRRAALGIVNIILKNNLNLSLYGLIETSLDILQEKNLLKREKKEVYEDVKEFFKQRVSNVFVDLGHAKDVVSAVIDKDFENLSDTLLKIKAVEIFNKRSEFIELVGIAKRVDNILQQSEYGEIDTSLFKEEVEKDLYEKYLTVSKETEILLEEKNYVEYFKTLLKLDEITNSYFDTIKIMDNDENIKNNRLAQLNCIFKILDEVVNLTFF